MELSCFFDDSTDVGNLISGSSAFSKSSLYIWKFLVQVLLKPCLKEFEHYLVSRWSEHNCMVVWAFFGIAFLWDWNEKWPFPVLWPLLNFPNSLTYYWVQRFNSRQPVASNKSFLLLIFGLVVSIDSIPTKKRTQFSDTVKSPAYKSSSCELSKNVNVNAETTNEDLWNWRPRERTKRDKRKRK